MHGYGRGFLLWKLFRCMKATLLGDKNFGPSREFGCFQRLSITVIILLPIRLVVVESQVAFRRLFVERFDCIGVRFAPLGVKCHMHLNTWYTVSIYTICMTCH